MSAPEISLEQQKSILNYKRFGIEITIVNSEQVKVKQTRLINGYILNQKQLHERGKEIFPDKHILPIVFSLDTKEISLEWIEEKMKKFGIKRKDLIKQVAFDENALNLLFLGKKSLNNIEKSSFFYYFLSYELNQNFRTYATLDNPTD